MKQVLAFLLLISSSLSSAINMDTTLMTIGGKKISLGEFEYLHTKNNQVVTEDENSADDYIDLFVNFKLKVIEAEELGLDTAASFVKELSGYRDQLAEPYLKDQDLDEQLIQEAYDRLKEEVDASHILISLKSDNPKDTLAAYNKAMEARQKVLSGQSFESVAKAYSDDPSAASNGGHLGFFTGFQMVLPFEEAAFNTPVGQVSMPARSRFGYHIITIHQRRASKGEVNISHILILSNDQMSEEEKAEKEKKAFSIYQQIQEGEDFEQLAKKYSDDHGSSTKGGNIGFIRTGQTIPSFEEVAFALENKGDISKPVLTRFGWHIIRLEDKKALPTYEEKKADIKRRLARDERGTKPEIVFLNTLKKEYDFKVNEENLETLYAMTRGKAADSLLRDKLKQMQDTIITFGDVAKTQYDLVAFTWEKLPNGTNFESKLAEFEKKSLMDYEKSRLELKYSDFKYLMNEYHDGLLLFEISNQKVWEKASKDTKGLNKFYKKNKKNYLFTDAYFGGQVIYIKDSTTLTAYNTLKVDLNLEEIKDSLNTEEVVIKSEKGFFKAGDNASVDYLEFNKGDSAINDEFSIVLLDGQRYEEGDKKPLDATRGAVISDYQNYLETKWVKSLRRKYKVKVDKDLLATLE